MKLRHTIGALFFGALVTAAIAHVDDPKARDLHPPVLAPVWRASEGSVAADFPAQGVLLRSWFPLNSFSGSPTSGNDCWGYVSPSGREYALMGLNNGTGIVEVTDPSSSQMVGHIAGPNSLWRDIKVFQNYAYVVSEGGGGIQVLSLANIDGQNPSAARVTLANTITVGGNSLATHNVAIDEQSGFLYRCGGGSNGIRIYDLNADPSAPAFVGQWNNVYVHDCQVVTYTSGTYAGKQIAFCCGGANGGNVNTGVYIVDVTNKAAPVQLGFCTYPGAKYCHQGWLTPDRRKFIVDDELDEGATVTATVTYVVNVANLAAPTLESQFNNGNQSIGHNLYTTSNRIFEANYRSGLRIFDYSSGLANATEVAYFDTYPADDLTQFNGMWSVYPYFPSGTIICSDLERGLFVLRLGLAPATFSYPNGKPTLVAPGSTITARVAPTGAALPAGSVKLVTTVNGIATATTMTALGNNLYSAAVPSIDCPASFTWTVRVDTVDGPFPDPAGAVAAVSAVSVAAAVNDACETQGSWQLSAPGDTATAGLWVNADPVGTAAQPEDDHSAAGTSCFVTGNGAVGGAVGAADLDGGIATLTTPAFDGTGDETFVSYWRWFSNNQGSNPNEDTMPISISADGGVSWTQLEDVSENAGAWVNKSFRIRDFVTPSANMRVRFVARDIGVGGSVVEAGIDDFQVVSYDCGLFDPTDLNRDGVTNGADLGLLLAGWGSSGSTDLNGDGTTNGADLGLLLAGWSS